MDIGDEDHLLERSDAPKRVVITSPSLPVVELPHRRFPAGLEVRSAGQLERLDLTAAHIDGALYIIATEIQELLLTSARVSGPVFIGESLGTPDWVSYTDAGDCCGCNPEFGSLHIGRIEAEHLRAHSLDLHGIVASDVNFNNVVVEGPIYMSRSRVASIASFHYARATGISMNSCELRRVHLSLINVDGAVSLACSKVGPLVDLWGARIDDLVQLAGTVFEGTRVSAFRSTFGALDLSSSCGSVQLLNLDHTTIRSLVLANEDGVRRTLEMDSLLTRGMRFDSVHGDLGQSLPDTFFEHARAVDRLAYKRLADAYATNGDHANADRAMKKHCWMFGIARQFGFSGATVAVVLIAWIGPALAVCVRGWPASASTAAKFVLIADLFLPDLVSLGAREKFEEELRAVTGGWLAAIAFYRLLGWLIVSIVISAIVLRAS